MEVVNANASLLSNSEVLNLLQELRGNTERGHRNFDKSQQALATISYETIKYLEKTPCKQQSPEVIASFLKAATKFSLSKAEKLMLLNLRPTTAVEINLLVEDAEERLNEDQVEELLEVVSSTLPEAADTE